MGLVWRRIGLSHLATPTSPQLSMGGFFLRGIFGVEDQLSGTSLWILGEAAECSAYSPNIGVWFCEMASLRVEGLGLGYVSTCWGDLEPAKASVKNDCFTPDIWFPSRALVSVKCVFYFSESDPLICALVSVKSRIYPEEKKKTGTFQWNRRGKGGRGSWRFTIWSKRRMNAPKWAKWGEGGGP